MPLSSADVVISFGGPKYIKIGKEKKHWKCMDVTICILQYLYNALSNNYHSFFSIDIPCIKGDLLKFWKTMYHGRQFLEVSWFVLLDFLSCLHLYRHVHALCVLDCKIKNKYLRVLYLFFWKRFIKLVFNLDLLFHRNIAMPITEQHTTTAKVINTSRIVLSFLCFDGKNMIL